MELARRARDRYATESGGDPSELLVAGSVGPYGAMLADGSEYRGDYDPGPAALRDLHAPRIEALLAAGVDLLAIETIPTMREAAVLLDLVEESGARAWLSYQCRDGATTAAGEPFVDAVALTDGRAGVLAVGVNCTAPRFVPIPARGGRDRHGPPAHRLSERRRPLVGRYPSLGRRGCRRGWHVSAGGRRRLGGSGRDLARWLLRDGPGRHPGARRRPRGQGRVTARRVGFVGVRIADSATYAATVALYRDVLGLDPTSADGERSARFRLADGTAIHVYGPADDDHLDFADRACIGLVVDDVDGAHAAIAATGLEILDDPIQRDGTEAWFRYRSPDGTVHEIIGPVRPGT